MCTRREVDLFEVVVVRTRRQQQRRCKKNVQRVLKHQFSRLGALGRQRETVAAATTAAAAATLSRRVRTSLAIASIKIEDVRTSVQLRRRRSLIIFSDQTALQQQQQQQQGQTTGKQSKQDELMLYIYLIITIRHQSDAGC